MQYGASQGLRRCLRLWILTCMSLNTEKLGFFPSSHAQVKSIATFAPLAAASLVSCSSDSRLALLLTPPKATCWLSSCSNMSHTLFQSRVSL